MNQYCKHKREASKQGVTLLELVFVMALLTVVAGVLFGMATGIGDASQAQAVRTTSSDEARKGILSITQQLRNSTGMSLSALPARTVTFRCAEDVDGNGSAVDVGLTLETGAPITIQRDTTDLNGDGMRNNQLVAVQNGIATVVANNLEPDEDVNGDGVLQSGEDINQNGRLDHGIWFERDGAPVRVTIQARGHLRNGREILFSMVENVFPRN